MKGRNSEGLPFCPAALLPSFLYPIAMRILGVDPGLTTAGLGLIETVAGKDPVAIEWLTIETAKELPLPERLKELASDLKEFLKGQEIGLAVVETLFFATNKRTAMNTAQARGVIVSVLNEHGIEVIEATPLQLKTAITGDGKADKKQMQIMIQRILKLKEIPQPADAADALGLALFGAYTKKFS